MTEQIELTIARNGSVTLETKGFTGERCREGSRFLEAALGIRQCERLTGEFYQAEKVGPLPLRDGQA